MVWIMPGGYRSEAAAPDAHSGTQSGSWSNCAPRRGSGIPLREGASAAWARMERGLERRRFVRVVVEDRPIRGNERYRVPGVPHRDTEDGSKVPEVLYPVVLKTEEGELTIGTVGSYWLAGERVWAWYALFGSTKSYLRGKRSTEAAVRELAELASGLKRTRGGAFHTGLSVEDKTPSTP
jgi:hypothetical protein